MRPYLAHIKLNLKLTLRDRLVLFFNYVFPLLFFFIFSQVLGAGRGGVATQLVAMVLIIGVLGNGFFGAGIRAVQDRELNILRRFKVAPVGPAPILVASLVTGWANYLPMAILVITASHFIYGMPLPRHWISLLLFLSLGILAFRAVGLMIASVVNSAQEGQILIQLFYFPMLFLSGATFPLDSMPKWVQSLAQFLPASHLFLGIQGIMVHNENLLDLWASALALAMAVVVATFLSTRLFRWEKEERMRGSSKAWLAAVMVPFLLLGGWQAYSQQNISKVRALSRDMRRSRTFLIRDVRIFVGDGKVIQSGSVLVKDGQVEQIFESKPPDPKDLRADLIEATGKTLLPGLIDASVRLSAPGGFFDNPKDFQTDRSLRELAAYLYSGVTAVRSVGDPPQSLALPMQRYAKGDYLGAELFVLSGQPARVFLPGLAQIEAAEQLAQSKADALDRTLVQQVGPAALLESTKRAILKGAHSPAPTANLRTAMEELKRAWESGIPLAAGSNSGTPLLIHGPALHRELQLWVQAGIPASTALQSATSGGSKLVGAEKRLGLIKPGYPATLLLVNGNPLTDISTTENIASVFFRGERVDRSGLFQQE